VVVRCESILEFQFTRKLSRELPGPPPLLLQICIANLKIIHYTAGFTNEILNSTGSLPITPGKLSGGGICQLRGFVEESHDIVNCIQAVCSREWHARCHRRCVIDGLNLQARHRRAEEYSVCQTMGIRVRHSHSFWLTIVHTTSKRYVFLLLHSSKWW